ncbi:hypothetical protein I3842_16G059700 [Carya illinoinensis]|uniref:Sacsin/Nov domain-containing protein n=2 Tax=Carya illinoinensis TaxID=32201 RepID=A0A922A996_CARIL|nr:hypothetical protein I3842_16G059700 [Carya illinoinensis]KAG6672489.1 hypothetical protein I3842_16G059700 [Carya illinoinensis]
MEMKAREHIEEIRRKKFSIGGELNPLTEDLHQAVKNLSAELYAKDVHFLMELIQNAEDNEYMEEVDPSLEFLITSEDITGTGAPATLLIFNNEKGFSSKNIDSICSVGRSTKKGNRKRGYIGEKGIGFKSVFLITTQPYIFSNGYQIRFNEEPCPHCNLGYIVPEWVEENPRLSDIQQIYGSKKSLPTTTIVLPLKPDKVKPVKQQLSSVHPEVLLFLTKLKRLSVREHNKNPKLNTVSAIAITSETNFVTRKNIDAESSTLHLSAERKNNGSNAECSYYMWKQKFPVRHENRVERRMDVQELVIILAFPFGERLNRGTSSPGIYAFLPTEMITNFPFIIQADFLLASSRETILLDSKWNQGILDCVSSAFIDAFISLVRTSDQNVPPSSLAPMFRFIPVNNSSYQELNEVRNSIKKKLDQENIIPSESYTEQKFFHKPCEVGRLMPDFWNILEKAEKQGVSLLNLSSHGKYILTSSFDKGEYDHILSFLGVEPVNNEWYAKCIQSSNLVAGVDKDLYLDILLFVAENWKSKFDNTEMKIIPLIKYLGVDGGVSLCSINECRNSYKVVSLSTYSRHSSWLINWNKEFHCVASRFFMPQSTQVAIRLFPKKMTLQQWLQEHVKVVALDVYDYAVHLNNCINNDGKLAIAFVHFLYHSFSKSHLSKAQVDSLCSIMPLVNNYGNLIRQRKGVLVPANQSKWAGLIGSNPWRGESYVELGEEYLRPRSFAGESCSREKLLEFLKTHVAASDIPDLSPPNVAIPAVSAPLTKQNAFLLLDWIQNLKCRRTQIPDKFLVSIKEGSWLKITTNGCSGCRPPSQSFMLTSSLGNILQNGSVLADIPLIDQSFYGDQINKYKEELKTIGVMFGYGEACEFIGKHLMSLADSSTLTRDQVLSVLNFIRFLKANYLAPEKFINTIKERRWLRTSRGDMSPVGSVLFNNEWKVASQISNLPFIDTGYFGDEILSFKEELRSLGVLIGFSESYKLVVDNLKSPSSLSSLTAEAVIFILECMRHSGQSNKLIETLSGVKCFKTNFGYRSPGECFLFDSQWACILHVFNDFPLIDHDFYGGSIFLHRNELQQLGVKVGFEETAKVFAQSFKQQAASMTKEKVLSFLSCYTLLKDTPHKFPPELRKYVREVKWLRTRLGDLRSPSNCILYGPDWQSIAPITLLPFIDDSDNYYGKDIHKYKKELKSIGVVTEFKDGVKFIVDGLFFPQDPSIITPANVVALLEFIRILLHDHEGRYKFPETFCERISKKWLKTNDGYRPPDQCLLFDSTWGSHLKHTDGPFLDEGFYSSNIRSYKKELNAIDVTVDVKKGCPLIARHLDCHHEILTISRIYNYLSKFGWEPDTDAANRIWIPNGTENGKWVSPKECVLRDTDELFSFRLQVLEKYYDDQKLLFFFSSAFNVKSNPSVDDYCQLWKVWETSRPQLSHEDCFKFWVYVSKHWSGKTERTLTDRLEKLPVASDSNGILLSNKHDVFIADDLQLKDLFEQVSPRPIFVWYPERSSPSLPRTKLLEMYRKIGVRTISESIKKEEASMVDVAQLNQVNPKDILIKKGLVRLILGFLADPVLKIEVERRHEAVKGLLNMTFLETVEPITVNYTLSLSSGENMELKASRMIRWDREESKFFAQKLDKSSGYKNMIEYATYFSEAISEGLLWENSDHIGALFELIKLCFVLEYNEEAIGFVMKTKNMQIFMEDEEFLASIFP